MKNESEPDRLVRAVIGLLVLVLAITLLGGIVQVVAFILAVGLLITAFTGYCGFYELLGINSNRPKPR